MIPDGANNLTKTTIFPQIDGCCFRTAYGTGRKLTENLILESIPFTVGLLVVISPLALLVVFVRGLLVVISPLALLVVFVRGLLGYRHR